MLNICYHSITSFKQTTSLGHASDVMILSVTNTGEPSYSLYIPSEYAVHVYDELMRVGKDYGIRNAGYLTLRFLRIEKFIPFWSEELDSETTPLEIGINYQHLNIDTSWSGSGYWM